MALYKIKDFDPDYRNHFDGGDIKDMDLYSGDQRIGSVDDVLVDENGRFRYLVINTGAWIFGKQVLLPIGRARIDYNARRAYADGLSKQQVEQLPEFNQNMTVDADHEERVRSIYRAPRTEAAIDPVTPMDSSYMAGMPGAGRAEASLETPGYDRASERQLPLEMPINDRTEVALENTTPTIASREVALENTTPTMASRERALDNTTPSYAGRDVTLENSTPAHAYNYDMEPDLYQVSDRNHPSVKLYEERLVAHKQRQKTGEVTIGKHIETTTQHVSVPVEKERVIIERVAGTNAAVTTGTPDFQEGEVARIEVYEETPDIQKEAFIREEVRVRKVVDQDTFNADEEIRREQLDVRTDGNPVVDESRQNSI